MTDCSAQHRQVRIYVTRKKKALGPFTELLYGLKPLNDEGKDMNHLSKLSEDFIYIKTLLIFGGTSERVLLSAN